MSEATPSTRDQVLRLFEATREAPGEPYEAEFLVQHLIRNPERTKDIHNSFKGKKQYVRFLEALETHFLVCFSLKDWDRLTSIDRIEARIEELRSSPRSSLASVANRVKARPPEMLAFAIVCFLGFPLTGICVKLFGWYGSMALLVPLVLVWLLYRMHRKDVRFYRELGEKIRANQLEPKRSASGSS